MGVDYYICQHCNETFPDCGPHGNCGKAHFLCGSCMDKLPEYEENDYGEIPMSVCPVCIAGGNIYQRFDAVEDERNRLLAFSREAARFVGCVTSSPIDAEIEVKSLCDLLPSIQHILDKDKP